MAHARLAPRIASTLCACFLTLLSAWQTLATVDAADRPRLIVVVSVDQLCQEYLSRFRANFADDGFFRQVEREGASYSECHHRHAFTLTGPGHAGLLTGVHPSQHGVIDNNWYDRKLRKTVYCVEDADFPIVGSLSTTELKGVSPRALAVRTVCDILQAETAGQAKIFGITLKDRAAVLMVGHKPDGVYWYDVTSGCWVTSRYYAPHLPDYLRQLNESKAVGHYAGKSWNLLLMADRYRLNYPDDSPFEDSHEQLGRAFPHRLDAEFGPLLFKQLPATPFGNEHTLAAAQLVVEHEQLGRDDIPDILALGLSSNDYVGHVHGPHSLEVEDLVYRTDRLLGQFVRFLDHHVGRGKWTLLLSADHAVAPIPEYAVTLGLPAKRYPLGVVEDLAKLLEAALQAKFGPPPAGLTYLDKFEVTHVYLRSDAVCGDAQRFQTLQSAARDFLLAQPGIVGAATRFELEEPNGEPLPLRNVLPMMIARGSDLESLVRHSFHAGRSGDVVYVLHPYQAQSKLRATHGSPWSYDTHVPLLLLGCGIHPGRFDRPIGPAAIASTVAKLARIPPPHPNSELPAAEALTP